jgi:hypothetical protein
MEPKDGIWFCFPEKLDLFQIASLHFIFPTRRRKGLQHNDDCFVGSLRVRSPDGG